jgi:uncharacterized GH25 family protein
MFMRLLFILVSFILTLPVSAHEYWIEPKRYVFPINTSVTAGLFNGQNFKGSEFPYFEKNFRRFELAMGDRIEPVKGRLGDYPALSMAALGEGLHVALFQSSGDLLNYTDFAMFTRFVKHKDFPTALDRHIARGLPQADFLEYYARFSKALLAVGGGAGQDRAHGLETEIVALKNPYTDNLANGANLALPVQVFYRGAPRVAAQIELFDKDAEGQVVITLHRTDADGNALLPVTSGHSYLVDAVVLREPEAGSEAEKKKAVWETLWAALTFAVP